MQKLIELALLLQQYNQIANQLATIINRPAQIGHVGEFIASQIFDRLNRGFWVIAKVCRGRTRRSRHDQRSHGPSPADFDPIGINTQKARLSYL